MMRSILAILMIIYLAYSFTISSPIEANQPFDAQSLLQTGISNDADSITWPFKEGPKAPYDIRPQTLILSTTPRKGSQFTFTVATTIIQTICGWKYNYEVKYLGKTVDQYHDYPHATCLKGGAQIPFSNKDHPIKLPTNYASGVYEFNVYISTDTGYGMDLYFYAEI